LPKSIWTTTKRRNAARGTRIMPVLGRPQGPIRVPRIDA
jgi:hypothetical protein